SPYILKHYVDLGYLFHPFHHVVDRTNTILSGQKFQGNVAPVRNSQVERHFAFKVLAHLFDVFYDVRGKVGGTNLYLQSFAALDSGLVQHVAVAYPEGQALVSPLLSDHGPFDEKEPPNVHVVPVLQVIRSKQGEGKAAAVVFQREATKWFPCLRRAVIN